MQTFEWYVRRLRSMGPHEIIWRIQSLVRDYSDLLRIPFGFIPKIKASEIPFDQFSPGFKCSPLSPDSWIAGESRTIEPWRERLVRKADLLLENRLSYFDLDAVSHGSPFNWHRDHSAEINSRIRPSVLTDYRDFSMYGDCKLVWEPNRHHHLVVLARAYFATRDPRYARKVAELLRSWIDSNPFGYGMNWKSGLEHGVRLINWVWALDLIRGSDVISNDLWADIRQFTYLLIWDTQRRYSRGTSANNHLVGEAAGVFIATCYFSDLPNIDEWRSESQNLLEQEILKQTFADGCTREHTFGYALFVLQFFTYSLYVGKKSGHEFSMPYATRLHSMYSFLNSVSADTGKLPNINDSDDGYVLDLGEKPDSPRQLVSVGAYIFDDPDLAVTDDCETVFWLYGTEKQSKHKLQEKQSIVYKDSGYAVLRSSRLSVFFDCAELGYGSIAAHGHADCLSILLSIDGLPVVVDSGTYDYFTFPSWRNYFRETRAHNTVVVDGKSQSEMLGPFLWGRRANARLIDWVEDEEYTTVHGQHDGYSRLPKPVTHSRKVKLHKNDSTLKIVDQLEGTGQHTAESYFHLAPNCNATIIDQRRAAISGTFGEMLLESSSGSLSILTPEDTPSPGWVSDGYHTKQKSTCIRISIDFVNKATNVCTLSL